VAVAVIATLVLVGVFLDRPETAGEPDQQSARISVPPPGIGGAVADSVYATVKPKVSETIFTPDPDSPRKYLMDRLNDAADQHPAWRFPQPAFARSATGPMSAMTLSSRDGSSLVFFDSPNPGRGTGLRLDSVAIRR